MIRKPSQLTRQPGLAQLAVNPLPGHGVCLYSSGMQHAWWRQRVSPTAAALLTLVAGLGCRAVFSGWLSKYGGVALWATLVYFLVLWVRPQLAVARAALLCLTISIAVELFQLTPVPRMLYELHAAFALVFGTTFNAWDLPAYAAGALLGAGVHAAFRRRSRHHAGAGA